MKVRLAIRLLYALACSVLLLAAPPSRAVELIVTPETTSVEIAPGGTTFVSGVITNITGVSLLTTDIFLNFSGYPAGTLEPMQLLGTPELSIADRSMSPPLALFAIQALPGATSGDSYLLEFFAVDINGVFSIPTSIGVSIAAVSAIPEPSSRALALAGLVLLMVFVPRQRRPRGD